MGRNGRRNIENHVHWMNPDSSRHFSSLPVSRKKKDIQMERHAALPQLHTSGPDTHLSVPERTELRRTLPEQYRTPMGYHAAA